MIWMICGRMRLVVHGLVVRGHLRIAAIAHRLVMVLVRTTRHRQLIVAHRVGARRCTHRRQQSPVEGGRRRWALSQRTRTTTR